MNHSNPTPHTSTIIDSASDLSSIVDALKHAGVQMAIRYYSSNASDAKNLTPEEAAALASADIKIGVVFQDAQNQASDFTYDLGYAAGTAAFNYAFKTIEQPIGSVITFAVDYNPAEGDLENNILPYFQGIHDAFEDLENEVRFYRVGVYGCGTVCNTLYAQHFCDYRWLSASESYEGTEDAIAQGAYELRQLSSPEPIKIGGVAVDYNLCNPLPSNAFEVTQALPAPVGSGEYVVRVSDNNRLHLRKSAEVQAESIGFLHKGQHVCVLDIDGKWACLKAVVGGKTLTGFADAEYLDPVKQSS